MNWSALEGSIFDRPLSPSNFQSLVRPELMREWQEKWDSMDTEGRFVHSIFPDVTLRPLFEGQKEERRFVCTVSRVLSGHCSVRSHLGRFRTVEDLTCVCAGDYETRDHLIWHCERFRLEKPRLIDALAAMNISIGIPIRDLCALKKWCAVKCCMDFLVGF
jgi:hypothetical protein